MKKTRLNEFNLIRYNSIDMSIQKTEQVKRKHTVYSILGVIGDYIFYPVIILSVISSFLMFASKKQGEVPSIFGFSAVTVLTGSMVNSGFYRGDTVFTIKKNTEKLNVGDIIAFYYTQDSADRNVKLTLVADKEKDERDDFVKKEDFKVDDRVSARDTDKKNIKVYFHEIIAIYYDEGGTIFFETKGSSNNTSDLWKIREDFVVGKYITTPVWLRKVIHFCTTSIGMVILVITPLSILIMFQSLSIIEQVNNILIEKKVVSRKIAYNSEESLKANVGIEMDLYNKVYFYYTTDDKEKDDVWNFLWEYQKSSTKKKDLQIISLANKSKEIVGDADEYFNLWLKNIKSKKFKNNLSKLYSAIKLEKQLSKMKVQNKGK